MDPEVLLQIIHDLKAEGIARVRATNESATEAIRQIRAERDELKARLAAMEAERDMLREDDVAQGQGDGPPLTADAR